MTSYTTQNTLPDNIRARTIPLLQTGLVEALDLAAQAKQAHWNVKGPNFVALHELFDQINADSSAHADMMAERLVSLGGQAHGTIKTVFETSGLNEYPEDASRQDTHLKALSSSLAKFGDTVRKASDTAGEIGDADSADLFTEISRAVSKSLWFVEAHI